MEITETFVVNKIKEKLGTKWKVIFEPELHERGCDIILRDELNKKCPSVPPNTSSEALSG